MVTGASRGIGAAIAETLAREGYDIWLTYRSDHDAAAAVARRIEESGRCCRLLCFDVADSAAVKDALEPLLEKESPSVLVNNAGFARDEADGLDERECLEGRPLRPPGRIFPGHEDGSARHAQEKGPDHQYRLHLGESGMAGQVNYSAAKAGLIGATRSLAAEIAKRKRFGERGFSRLYRD